MKPVVLGQPSFWLGLWGALLSTVLAVVKIFEFRADRGKLRLELIWRPGSEMGPGGVSRESWSAALPALRLTNRGRRTIQVKSIGPIRPGRGRSRDQVAAWASGLPATLGEGDSVTVVDGRISDWVIGSGPNADVMGVFARDSLGRDWRTKRGALKKFRRLPRPTESDDPAPTEPAPRRRSRGGRDAR